MSVADRPRMPVSTETGQSVRRIGWRPLMERKARPGSLNMDRMARIVIELMPTAARTPPYS